MDLYTETIQTLPLWVRLSNLDLKFWGLESLSKICSVLGIPLKTDPYTKEKSLIHYARVLIEFPVAGPFPEHIEFFDEHDVLIRQQVVYEWLPLKCTHCGMFGHEEPTYKNKGVIRKEWQRIQARAPTEPSQEPSPPTPPAPDAEGFIPVSHRTSARQVYDIEVIHMTEQLIHCRATQLSTPRAFLITYTYSFNWIQQRAHLSTDLSNLSLGMTEPWCVLGDFNTILYKEDQMGGDEVADHEIQELQRAIDQSELHELHSSDAYYSWTNRTQWSRIDRVFVNGYWHVNFDYTHSKYLTNGLSDHAPILIHFPSSPKPRKNFQFCDMWCTQQEFLPLLRPKLQHLHRDKFGDLRLQEAKARQQLANVQAALENQPDHASLLQQEKELRDHYISILASSLKLMKQQNKMEWLGYGDECSKLFYAKTKQRKLTTYIYSIQDESGAWVEGFEQVGKTMVNFYHQLLSTEEPYRLAIGKDVIAQGHTLSREQQLSLCKPFSDHEIKTTLFLIPNHKSPRPDGYNNGVILYLDSQKQSAFPKTKHIPDAAGADHQGTDPTPNSLPQQIYYQL
ncbi:hypothetical protein Cgig2_020573 [Carnegiea gigantea]|uniref:Endonuclease/exonuclease/phosphatase domain-containing protein n=1 Tax=Carnegiea gigantea TaxID=171969 RepID=A0A9Q1GG21_9CARY|nr:hypothetical protein Cgig2_020573 [Carnegiea gigantea]